MEPAKNTFMSRTNWAGIAAILLGGLDQFVPIFGGALPSWSLSIIGAIMMLLRQFTTSPVSVTAPVSK